MTSKKKAAHKSPAPAKAKAKRTPPRKPPAKPKAKVKQAPPAKPTPQRGKATPKEEAEPKDFSKAPIEVWTPPANGGRPKVDIDPFIVEELASIGCTLEEIAAVCRVCPRTLSRRKEADPEFVEALDRGQNAGRASLRRMLWVNAQRGNIAAQIFLAKQKIFLGYVDKVEHTGTDGEPIMHHFKVTFVDPPPREAPGPPTAE